MTIQEAKLTEEEQRLADSKYLRRGDKAKIAEQADVERNTVTAFVKSRIKNSVVEIYFNNMVQKRKQEFQEATQ